MDAPIQDSRWLWRCANILLLTIETGRFNHGPHGFAGGLRAEHTEALPALGVAVILQAVSFLLFFASAIWTGKLCRKSFLCWYVIFMLLCAGYNFYHWPSMEGLFLGAAWPATIAGNIWMTIHYHIKVRMAKNAGTAKNTSMAKNARMAIAHASVGLFPTAKRQDCGDDSERMNSNSSSSMVKEFASECDWFFAYAMLFNFSAGAIGFFFAYLTGTHNTALTTFGLGFTGMLIVAFVLLGTTSTSKPERLAKHFKLANVISSAVFMTIAIIDWRRLGLYNFGWSCVVHWAACLYSGIAKVLVQTSVDEDLTEEGHDSEHDGEHDGGYDGEHDGEHDGEYNDEYYGEYDDEYYGEYDDEYYGEYDGEYDGEGTPYSEGSDEDESVWD